MHTGQLEGINNRIKVMKRGWPTDTGTITYS